MSAPIIERENFSRGISEFMSFLGIILILISISLYDGSLTYPSAFTLVPVIGTFLLLGLTLYMVYTSQRFFSCFSILSPSSFQNNVHLHENYHHEKNI